MRIASRSVGRTQDRSAMYDFAEFEIVVIHEANDPTGPEAECEIACRALGQCPRPDDQYAIRRSAINAIALRSA